MSPHWTHVVVAIQSFYLAATMWSVIIIQIRALRRARAAAVLGGPGAYLIARKPLDGIYPVLKILVILVFANILGGLAVDFV